MRPRLMARTFSVLTALLAAALLVAGCSVEPAATPTGDSAAWLAAHELDGLDGRAVVEHLDSMPIKDRPSNLIASVRSDAVLLSDTDGNEAPIALPDDEFYLSIAPYIDQTHECVFHSLTTCVGELRNEQVRVTVTTAEDDAVIVDETVRTYDNGFAGLWLPRGIDATLTVEYDGHAASIPVSTASDAPTCLTTLRLT